MGDSTFLAGTDENRSIVGNELPDADFAMDVDKENMSPPRGANAAAAMAIRSTQTSIPTERLQRGDTMDRDVLGEVVVAVPSAFQDHPFSDIESSSGESDFHTENLAELLAERIERNADGRYDFNIYVDPEN